MATGPKKQQRKRNDLSTIQSGDVDSIAAASVEDVLEILANDQTTPSSRIDTDILEETANYLVASIDGVERLKARIYPSGVVIGIEFYERLRQLFVTLEFRDPGSTIVGLIWVSSLKQLNTSGREELLRLFPSCDHLLFEFLNSIPVVLSGCRLRPHFCMEFILALQKQVGKDHGGGGLWRGISKWAEQYPDDAFEGLLLLLQHKLNDELIGIGAAILGRVRVSWDLVAANAENQEIAERLRNDPDVLKRLVYHRSWISTGRHRGLSHEQFTDCLTRMANGTTEEQGEAFSFLAHLMVSENTRPESIQYGVKWLTLNSSSSIPDISKHFVVLIIHALATTTSRDDDPRDELQALLTSVMPIAFENERAWRMVEKILIHFVGCKQNEFRNWLLALADADVSILIKQFKSHGRFRYLRQAIAESRASKMLVGEFFSTIRSHRKLAFALYNELSFSAFPKRVMSSLSDDEIALSILESRLQYFKPGITAEFLLALRKRAEEGSEPLLSLYQDELLYQAKNLPGEVLQKLKAIRRPSPLIKQVVERADEYFEKLKLCYYSAINSIEVPGWRRSAGIQGRRQRKNVDAEATNQSVFKGLFPISYLLYGSEGFRYCSEGEISPLSNLQSMSATVEMPRLAMIDPEGVAIRRHETAANTDRLATSIREKESHK